MIPGANLPLFNIQAALCFNKANLLIEEQISWAYLARQDLKVKHRLAGRLTSSIATSYAQVGSMFRKAAEIASGSQARLLYPVGAELWILAGEPLEAGKDFERGHVFERSALAYLTANSYDDAVRIAREKRVSKLTRDKVLNRSRMAYLRSNQLVEAASLFQDDDSLEECKPCVFPLIMFSQSTITDDVLFQ